MHSLTHWHTLRQVRMKLGLVARQESLKSVSTPEFSAMYTICRCSSQIWLPQGSQKEPTVGSDALALWAVVGALFAVAVPQWGIYHSNGCFSARLLEVKVRPSTVICLFSPSLSLRKVAPEAGLQQANKKQKKRQKDNRRRGKEDQEKRRECKAGWP